MNFRVGSLVRILENTYPKCHINCIGFVDFLGVNGSAKINFLKHSNSCKNQYQNFNYFSEKYLIDLSDLAKLLYGVENE